MRKLNNTETGVSTVKESDSVEQKSEKIKQYRDRCEYSKGIRFSRADK